MAFCKFFSLAKNTSISESKSETTSCLKKSDFTTNNRKPFVNTKKQTKTLEHNPLIAIEKHDHIKKHKESSKMSNHFEKDIIKKVVNITECSIFEIDEIIKRNLCYEAQMKKQYQNELENMKTIFLNDNKPTNLYNFEHAKAQQNMMYLREKLKDIEGSYNFGLYVLRSEGILSECKNIMESSQKKSFVIKESQKQSPNNVKISCLISLFYTVAKDYIDLEGLNQLPRRMVCDVCYNYSFIVSGDDDSIYICNECKTQKEIFNDTPSFKDTNRVNMSSKYTYSRKGHFLEAMKEFQGTQNIDIKKLNIALETMREEIKKHNLITEQGKKRSVTKEHIHMFLGEQGLSAHYRDLYLIFHLITGEPCADLSDVAELIIDDFDKLEEELQKLKDGNRSNALIVYYTLYKLLQRRGFPYRKDDFFILKTKTKEDEHDETMKKAWDNLGWPWEPTF